MSYMKIMKDKVSNFLRQKTRIGKHQTTSGDNSGAGAKQLKNLTSLLGACEENINASCNANLPKDCQMKTGEKACTCWTNSTLEFSANAVKKCDIKDDNKKMTEAKKECTTAFGKCRKIEDS